MAVSRPSSAVVRHAGVQTIIPGAGCAGCWRWLRQERNVGTTDSVGKDARLWDVAMCGRGEPGGIGRGSRASERARMGGELCTGGGHQTMGRISSALDSTPNHHHYHHAPASLSRTCRPVRRSRGAGKLGVVPLLVASLPIICAARLPPACKRSAERGAWGRAGVPAGWVAGGEDARTGAGPRAKPSDRALFAARRRRPAAPADEPVLPHRSTAQHPHHHHYHHHHHCRISALHSARCGLHAASASSRFASHAASATPPDANTQQIAPFAARGPAQLRFHIVISSTLQHMHPSRHAHAAATARAHNFVACFEKPLSCLSNGDAWPPSRQLQRTPFPAQNCTAQACAASSNLGNVPAWVRHRLRPRPKPDSSSV